MPPTCTGSGARTPCAAASPGEENFPPLFYCVFVGSGGEVATGPFNANRTVDVPCTTCAPYFDVLLKCPLPSIAELSTIGEYKGDGADVSANLCAATTCCAPCPNHYPNLPKHCHTTVRRLHSRGQSREAWEGVVGGGWGRRGVGGAVRRGMESGAE